MNVYVDNPAPSSPMALLTGCVLLFTIACATATAVWVSWNVIDWLDNRRTARRGRRDA